MQGSMEGQTSADPGTEHILRIGVDVGGTFTDLVAFDPTTKGVHVVKIPSSPPFFEMAVIGAVGHALKKTKATSAHIVHGSTVATNALLQRAGEPVAFVTTEGFRDMLLIGRQNRPKLYALNIERPRPLTDEANWFTVRERIDFNGNVVESLDPSEVDGLIEHITSRGLRHVAVCLLFSFVNPAHERLIGERCARSGLTVSLSCDVLPEFREYERASTTVINASLRPVVEKYLKELEIGLSAISLSPVLGGEGRGEGLALELKNVVETQGRRAISPSPQPSFLSTAKAARHPLRIMHSGGGTLSVADASVSAAKLVLSGPAGGVLGAATVAASAGFRNVITYDMGGTSTDVAVIIDGQPQWTTGSTVDGLPIGLPAFDIHTVGAGGGSIAHLDPGGALRVGPRSAGAIPGPACYGRGGTQPTVTDANVVLRRLLPEHFLGGSMSIDATLAYDAVEKLADQMSKTPIEAALGIVRVAEANMASAVRAMTARRGHDPREFTLVSFGGAAGLHACAVADELDIPRVLVPPYRGVLSALGMAAAPAVVDASRTVVHLGDALDDSRLAAELGVISSQTIDQISYEETASIEVFADVRYRGQSHEIKVRVKAASVEPIFESFRQAYAALYGFAPLDRAIEIVTLRLRRFGRSPEVHWQQSSPSSEATGTVIHGERSINFPDSTLYLPTGWSALSLNDGGMLLERMTS